MAPQLRLTASRIEQFMSLLTKAKNNSNLHDALLSMDEAFAMVKFLQGDTLRHWMITMEDLLKKYLSVDDQFEILYMLGEAPDQLGLYYTQLGFQNALESKNRYHVERFAERLITWYLKEHDYDSAYIMLNHCLSYQYSSIFKFKQAMVKALADKSRDPSIIPKCYEKFWVAIQSGPEATKKYFQTPQGRFIYSTDWELITDQWFKSQNSMVLN